MRRRLVGGVLVAASLATVLGIIFPLGLIDCDLFWWAIECWFV